MIFVGRLFIEIVTVYFRMESTGKPEQVHISEVTASFLGEAYYLDEGEEVFGEYEIPIITLIPLRYFFCFETRYIRNLFLGTPKVGSGPI